MKKFICLLPLVLLGFVAIAYGSTVNIYNYSRTCSNNNGTCIDGLALTSARYTGWISVDGFSKLTLSFALTDVNNSVTAVTVSCQQSWDSSTANGSGYDLCSGATAAGTTTMTCPHTWSFANAYADHSTLTVDNLNARFVNCLFTGTGSPASADVITVKAMVRTP